jgi:uncharacterized protein DUF3160
MLNLPIYGCGNNLKKWYVKLYFWLIIDTLNEHYPPNCKADNIVADIHTAPTDEVGWVKHIGSGPVNMAFVIAQTNEGFERVYSGPVKSYFEFTTSKFNKLTDLEWKDTVKFADKPSFVNYYKAEDWEFSSYQDYIDLRTGSLPDKNLLLSYFTNNDIVEITNARLLMNEEQIITSKLIR